MLAALLGWGQGTFASKVDIERRSVEVTREVDGGLQTIEAEAAGDRHDRPAPERAALRLLPNIMKAKKKPLDEKAPGDYGVDVAPRLKVLKVRSRRPQGRRQGRFGRRTRVDKLKNEAGVI
jgi:electron transfer flavoprotein beta subunit